MQVKNGLLRFIFGMKLFHLNMRRAQLELRINELREELHQAQEDRSKLKMMFMHAETEVKQQLDKLG